MRRATYPSDPPRYPVCTWDSCWGPRVGRALRGSPGWGRKPGLDPDRPAPGPSLGGCLLP